MASRIKKSGAPVARPSQMPDLANIPNVPWDTVGPNDEDGINGPYFGEVGKNGESVRLKLTTYDYQILLQLSQSGKWPGIGKTTQHFIRHFTHVMLEKFAKHLNDKSLDDSLASMRIMQRNAQREYEATIYQETLFETEKTVSNLRKYGHDDKVQEVLQEDWDVIQGMSTYWRRVWEETFKQKFPDFKPSNP